MHFSPLTRAIFFLVLATLFIITTSVLVAYSLGYRYNFDRGIFVHSGSITIKTNPSRVSLSVDGEPLESKKINIINGSYQIDGLRPGRYRVEVSAPGFSSWTKNITVESGVTSEYWNVLLARNSYPVINSSIPDVIGIFPSPDGSQLAVSSDHNGELLVLIVDPETLKAEQVFSSRTHTRLPSWALNIEWSPDANSLIIPTLGIDRDTSNIIPADNREADEVFLVEIATTKSTQLSTLVPEIFTQTLGDIRWGPSSETLYALSGNQLITIDRDRSGDAQIETLFTDTISYDFSQNKLFTLRSNGILYMSERRGENPEQITTAPPKAFSDEPWTQLIVYDRDRISARTPSGKLYIWNTTSSQTHFHTKDDRILGMQFSNDGKKLLFWNETRIFTYFMREWEVQPKREENSFLEVAAFTDAISNVSWTKQYEHILYTSEQDLFVIELDHRDRRDILTIDIPLSEGSPLLQFFPNDQIFFASEDENSPLSFISFPEDTPLFTLGQ